VKLNHLNLCVGDLAAARDFFERHFDFRCHDQKGQALAIMDDGHSFTLVLSDSRQFGGEPPRYPEGFHVGFLVDTPTQVDQAYDRLATTEVPLGQRPRKLHGSYSFYFTALDSILFEVACSLA
jgi:catechol 2,3-dioxygenase-like lactoylglutathione lyase family enzyme